MKCPMCGGAELVRDTRDLPHSYKGRDTIIRAVTGDHCSACQECILDRVEAERFGQLLRSFRQKIEAGFSDPG